MAKKISESLMIVIITDAAENGLTAVLMQAFVGPMCAPAMAKGTVKKPAKTANHRTKKKATMIFSLWNTALTRRKKRNAVDVPPIK